MKYENKVAVVPVIFQKEFTLKSKTISDSYTRICEYKYLEQIFQIEIEFNDNNN